MPFWSPERGPVGHRVFNDPDDERESKQISIEDTAYWFAENNGKEVGNKPCSCVHNSSGWLLNPWVSDTTCTNLMWNIHSSVLCYYVQGCQQAPMCVCVTHLCVCWGCVAGGELPRTTWFKRLKEAEPQLPDEMVSMCQFLDSHRAHADPVLCWLITQLLADYTASSVRTLANVYLVPSWCFCLATAAVRGG